MPLITDRSERAVGEAVARATHRTADGCLTTVLCDGHGVFRHRQSSQTTGERSVRSLPAAGP